MSTGATRNKKVLGKSLMITIKNNYFKHAVNGSRRENLQPGRTLPACPGKEASVL